MIKFAVTVGTAAILAGVITVLPGMTPNVEAGTPTVSIAAPKVEAPVQPTKADRLPIVTGSACSQRAWPYYDQNCLVDSDSRLGEPRKVRIVTTDRLQ